MEEWVLKKEQIQELKKAFSVLSPRQKLVLDFYFYKNLTLQEISEQLDITLSTVQTHLERGLEKLRKEMEKTKKQ